MRRPTVNTVMYSKEGPVTFARPNLKAQGVTCMKEVVLYVHYSWVLHILYVHYSWVLYIYAQPRYSIYIYIYIYIKKYLELEPSPSACYQCTEPAVIVSLHNLNNLQLIVPYKLGRLIPLHLGNKK